jgi:uncharacterized protein YndB with AHSA1/START domain
MNTARLTRLGHFSALLSALLATACGPSLEELHDRARTGAVQPDAPIRARGSVTIAAPRARVYALLTDFAAWPRWQSNVTKVTPPPSLDEGATFTWVNGGTPITSRLAAVQPDELVAWSGSASVAKAIHVWRFSSPTPETTRVDVEESMDGFLLTWFYGQKDLEAEVARSLERLRAASEAPAASVQ